MEAKEDMSKDQFPPAKEKPRAFSKAPSLDELSSMTLDKHMGKMDKMSLEDPGKKAPAQEAAQAVYTAEGDPYTYGKNPDGSVEIIDGPTGKGTKISKGLIFDAIMAQIESGQLTASGGEGPMEDEGDITKDEPPGPAGEGAPGETESYTG